MTKVCFEDFITTLYLHFKSAIDTVCHKPAFIVSSPKNTHYLGVFSSQESLYIPCISTYSLSTHNIVLVWNVYKLPLSLTIEPLKLISADTCCSAVFCYKNRIVYLYPYTKCWAISTFIFSYYKQNIGRNLLFPFFKKWVLFKWIQL